MHQTRRVETDMTFAAMIPYILLVLFGAALVAAAFNAKRLIGWENRVLGSLADAVQEYRESLEEEQRLLQAEAVPAECQTQDREDPQKKQHKGIRAA